MSLRDYVFATLGIAAAMILAAALLVISVDPYRLHGTSLLLDERAPRPAAHNQAIASKSQLALRLKPATVVLGNSRVDVGISPESPSWPADAHPVFNFGLPGVGLSQSLQLYRRLHSSHPARLIVIGLDFMDFLSAAKATPGDQTSPSTFRRVLETHVSLQSLSDAFLTLVKQTDPFSDDLTIKGFNPLRSYYELVRIEGYAALVAQKNIENAKRLAQIAKPTYDFASHPLMAELRTFLLDMAKDGAHIKLVIYPYHADLLEFLRIADLWGALEAWKVALTDLVDETSTEAAQVRLWDFARYDGFTSEPVPPPGDLSGEMRFYWEAGHFKPSLGDLVIARMFETSSVDFGDALTRQSVSRILAEHRARQLAYRVQRPGEVARVENIFQQIARQISIQQVAGPDAAQ